MSRFLARLIPPQRAYHDAEYNFPTKQLFVLALCRLCEPIAFMSIFPYSYSMVESFDGDWDKTDVSEYAAWMFSAFAFGEFFSGMLWGKVSDCVGRKPVLLMGLFGTAVSMIWFGFARSFWVACAARAVGGILNGNMGVLNTTVAELVPRKDHQSWVFSMIPFVWSVGTIIGSALGGSLAMPCDSHPSWFSRGSLWETYPFLLPNLVCVFIILIGIVFGFLYLEETHTARKAARNRRATIDHGPGSDKASLFPAGETQSLLGGDPPPGYSSVESSPLLRSTPAAAFECDSEILAEKAAPEPKRTINKQIILIIAANATLAYHSISFDTLMPVLLSERRLQMPPALPFKFSGGFALAAPAIGFMFAIQGAYSMVAQLWLFRWITSRLGNLRTSRYCLMFWILLDFAVPYMVLLPEPLQGAAIYFCLMAKITFQVICFPANIILLNNSVRSKSSLGFINGLAASTTCLARGFGPIATGKIHAAGLRLGYSGLGWWAAALICALGTLPTYWMRESREALDDCSNRIEPSASPVALAPATTDSSEDCITQPDGVPSLGEVTQPFHQ